MAYSAQTTHYGLPLPTGSDKSSFLDTNESFTAVDTALYGAVTGQAEVETEVQNLNAEILTMQSGITDINTAIGGLQNGLASTNLLVQEHADDITALETGKQDKTDNNLVTTDKTIVGAINELAGAGPGTVDADDVTYDNTTSGLTANNVQAAIDEIVSGSGVDADDVTYDNTTSGLTATNVQAAIDEVASSQAPEWEHLGDYSIGDTVPVREWYMISYIDSSNSLLATAIGKVSDLTTLGGTKLTAYLDSSHSVHINLATHEIGGLGASAKAVVYGHN